MCLSYNLFFLFNLIIDIDKHPHYHVVTDYVADLALEMLNQKETLAFARGDNGETGLHVLARKHSGCGCQSVRYRKHLLHFCKCLSSLLFYWEKIMIFIH